MQIFEISEFTVLAEIEAHALERKICRHPLYDRESIIILGSHVTMEAGSGCVHTAPGHGRDDYEVGLLYGLDVYSPVDDSGCFTKAVDFFQNQFVFDANREIVKKLRETGFLMAKDNIQHSYPHCWRCKEPVIFRATPQWFISMDEKGLRKNSLEEIDRVEWIPDWGRDRIYGMIENRPDWCISRQRAWGVPITIIYCENCEALLINQEIVDQMFAQFEAHGADIWFEKDVAEFLPDGAVCHQCGHQTFVKETDILDVWFESGVSHAAVLEDRDYLTWPADLYLEGSDQHRGWFHSSLLAAVGTRGMAPYNSVLTHGFVVDADGKKMSKSLGNVIAPDEVIKKHGAEILRLWVAASDYKDDIRISENILKQLSDAYRRIRNTSRFLLGNLNDFDPEKHSVSYESMLDIDKFALHRLQVQIERCLQAYQAYDFHVIYHALYNYCIVDLSSFYLDILKDRLYTSTPASVQRRSAQTVMHIIVDSIARLMAPILAFTSEEIWKFMPNRPDKEPSVHLTSFPVVNPAWLDSNLAEKWGRLLDVRGEVTKALEEARAKKIIGHSLDSSVTISANQELYDALSSFTEDLSTLFIVSGASLVKGEHPEGAYESSEIEGLSIIVEASKAAKCERCWVHDQTIGSAGEHPTICSRCLKAVQEIV
jgi:isoleucyl-tRNA synthetase